MARSRAGNMLTADAPAAHVPSRTVSIPRISRVPGVLRCALVSSAYQAAPTEATTLHEQTLAGRERILGPATPAP